MKVALAQTAPRLGLPDANLKSHVELIRRAKRSGASLVVFPELSLTGYLLQDLVPDVAEAAASGPRLAALAAASKEAGVVAGFVERASGTRHFNAAGAFADGRLLHVHRKVYLPTYGMFDEGRYFAAGESFRAFDAPWGRTGLLICEDFWHLSSTYLLALQGIDLLVVISASPVKGLDGSKDLRSRAPWMDLARVLARQHGIWVVYANRSGYEEGWAFQGGSFVCAPTGDLVAGAAGLKPDLVVAELPEALMRKARLATPIARDEKADLVLKELDRVVAERDRAALEEGAAGEKPA